MSGGGACYQYSTVAVTDVRPEADIRARVSAVAADRIRQGPEAQARLLRGFTVAGRVSRLTQDSVVIGVERIEMEANVRAKTTRSDFALLRSDLQQVQLKQLNRRRTILTSTALSLATVAAVVIAVERGGRSTGSTPTPGGPPEQRIPLGVRIGFP